MEIELAALIEILRVTDWQQVEIGLFYARRLYAGIGRLYSGIKGIARRVIRRTRRQPSERHILVSRYSYLDSRKPITVVLIRRRRLIRIRGELRCSTVQSFSPTNEIYSTALTSINSAVAPPTPHRLTPTMLYHGIPTAGSAATCHRNAQHDNDRETFCRHHHGRPRRNRGGSHRQGPSGRFHLRKMPPVRSRERVGDRPRH